MGVGRNLNSPCREHTPAVLDAQPDAEAAGSLAVPVPRDATLKEHHRFEGACFIPITMGAACTPDDCCIERLRKWNKDVVVLLPLSSAACGGPPTPPEGPSPTTTDLGSRAPKVAHTAPPPAKCFIIDLPLDFLFEASRLTRACSYVGEKLTTCLQLARYLHPKDLLALRRTCKSLHSCLGRHRGVWIAAIEGNHVPTLPPCPEDISPVRYSQLLFGHTCFVSVLHTVTFHFLTWSTTGLRPVELPQCQLCTWPATVQALLEREVSFAPFIIKPDG